MIDFYRHLRESQQHADDMMRAARRKDYQAARAIGRLAAISLEMAVRELPETAKEPTR